MPKVAPKELVKVVEIHEEEKKPSRKFYGGASPCSTKAGIIQWGGNGIQSRASMKALYHPSTITHKNKRYRKVSPERLGLRLPSQKAS